MNIVVMDPPAAPDQLDGVIGLRTRVWTAIAGEQTARSRFGRDRHDSDAWHVLAMRGGSILGCGRMSLVDAVEGIPEPDSFAAFVSTMRFPIAVFSRLVVDDQFQRLRIGTAIDSRRVALAAELGAREIWVEARPDRASGLERLGFQEAGRSGDVSIAGDWRIYRNRLGVEKGSGVNCRNGPPGASHN